MGGKRTPDRIRGHNAVEGFGWTEPCVSGRDADTSRGGGSRMRLRWWALWATLGLSGHLAAEQGGGPAEPIDTLRARCPTTRNLAPAAFEGMAAPSAEQIDEWQQRIRGSLRTDGPPANAEVVLRAVVGGSMTQTERSETATVLWRLPDGSWHFVAVEHYPNRWTILPPPAGLTDEQIEAARRSLSGGPLDGAQATALDALLADPCLDAEPSVVAGALPLLLGVRPMQPCYDGVAHTVELVGAGRRRVYMQACLHFLAGELIGLALSPHAEGEGPVMPAGPTLASLESARAYAEEVLREKAEYGSGAWVNATDAAGGYAFIHRESGFRCAATQPAEIQVYGPAFGEPSAGGGRCVRNAFRTVRGGTILSEWTVARRQSPSDVQRRVRAAADDWFSGHYGSEAPRRIDTRTVTIGGVRMLRAEVAGEPHADARDDELTVVLGAEQDGWTVVVRATGSAADPAAVDDAAVREWRHVLETRAPAQG